MEKFIRIDVIGEWRGTEHVSSLNGFADEWMEEGHGGFEEGISCYSLSNKAEGIENLREYWYDIAMFTTANRFEGMQITIFEGEKIGEGSDYEDLALCEKTVAELDAVKFMGKVLEAYERYEDEEITEEEYYGILEGLL